MIDATNGFYKCGDAFTSSTEAILANCNCTNVVKCFNTTGFENMLNPVYNNEPVDMFVAGSSAAAKKVAIQLAKNIGFGELYDFGGNDTFHLMEQLAMCRINLAVIQKHGRDIAFKVQHRHQA